MSATIFADIKRRGVENAWNTLAIAANTCAYRTRLNVQVLSDEGRSLSLCLLAQFLLNGEITARSVKHNRADRELLQHTAAGVLHQINRQWETFPSRQKEGADEERRKYPQLE